ELHGELLLSQRRRGEAAHVQGRRGGERGRPGRDVSGVPYRRDGLARAVCDVREHDGAAPRGADRIRRSTPRRRARQVISVRSDAMRTLLYLTLVLSAGCAAAGARQATPGNPPAPAPAAASQAAAESMSVDRAQYPSTYRRHANPPVLIRNATIMTATGPQTRRRRLAIAGGITPIQALPGCANLIGGRSAILKLVPARTVQEMKFPGARDGLKMACGENPKRVYGRRGGPATRMGNMAGYR